MIETNEQAQAKACQLLGYPQYFRVMQVRPLTTIDNAPPQWIVTADIGRVKKFAQVSVMFPRDAEPVPDRPEDGSFGAKLWDLNGELRKMTQLIDYGLQQPPSAGSWWKLLDKGVDSLRGALRKLWQDKF